MNKQSKENWGLALAAAGLAAMILLQRSGGGSELSGSGGLGGGESGLPAMPSTGGGADTPTINIDFPAIPELRLMDIPGQTPGGKKLQDWDVDYFRDQGTKKEQAVNASTLPPWEIEGMGSLLKDPSNPNVTGRDIANLPYILKAATTKKEVAPWGTPLLNPVYDFAVTNLGYGSRSGYKTTQQMRSEGQKSSSGSETTRYAGKAPTKKESRVGGGGGSSGGGGYYVTGYTTGPSDPGYYSSVMSSISSGISRGL